MAARTKATSDTWAGATATTAGVLRPEEFARHFTLTRQPAGAGVLPAHIGAALADPDLVAEPDRWREVAETGLAGIRSEPDPRYDRVLAVIGDMRGD